MHVESLAVYDKLYSSSDYRQTIAESSAEATVNLSQVVAVGAICNAATFGPTIAEKEQPVIVGDATGM